jgi:hypothetical protein
MSSSTASAGSASEQPIPIVAAYDPVGSLASVEIVGATPSPPGRHALSRPGVDRILTSRGSCRLSAEVSHVSRLTLRLGNPYS